MDNESEMKPESGLAESEKSGFVSRFSGIVLMVMILAAAGIFSALTAMRFAIRTREVQVPSLIGLTPEEAGEVATAEKLILKVMPGKRFSTEVPEGRIMGQIPAAKARVKTNSGIKVLVSIGNPKKEVPRLVGGSLRTAQLTLVGRLLTLGNVTSAYTEEDGKAIVADQWPRPGPLEGADPAVNVFVSLGRPEEYFIMPDLIGQPAELAAARARQEGFRLIKSNPVKSAGAAAGSVVEQKPRAGSRLSRNDTIQMDVSQ
jgi:serine/threonine-protein kinase